MKKSILIGLVSIILLGSIVSLMSFKSSPPVDDAYIVVKTHESHNKMLKAYVLVTNGTEIIKTIDLETARPKQANDNLLIITSVLNDIKSQGYTLISSNSSCSEWMAMTNYIFEKK